MQRHSQESQSRKAGFTLMELLLVMSLLVVLTGLSVVGISRFYSSQPLDQSVETLRIEFTRTRTFAIDGGIPWVITLADDRTFSRSPDEQSAAVADEVSLPNAVRATSTETIRFYPDGTVTGAIITLTDTSGVEQVLILDRLTGMLRPRVAGGRHDS